MGHYRGAGLRPAPTFSSSIFADLQERPQVIGTTRGDPGLEVPFDLARERRLQKPLVNLHFKKIAPVANWTFNANLRSLFHGEPPSVAAAGGFCPRLAGSMKPRRKVADCCYRA